MVSVAMATYNGEKYLLQQLMSILNQTRKPDEVIICDDGSSDQTISMIEGFFREYNLENWKLIRNEQNLGYAENFKKALSLTTGDIVFLADQDDIWLLDKIEKMSIILENDSKIMCLFSGFCCIDSNGNLVQYAGTPKLKKQLLTTLSVRDICRECNYNGMALAINRTMKDLFLSISEPIPFAHDNVINILAAAVHGMYVYSIILSEYRIHEFNVSKPGQMKTDRTSSKQRIKGIQDRIQLFQMFHLMLLNVKAKMPDEALEVVDNHIKVYQLRENALKTNSLCKAILLFPYIHYYPYFKTYLGDILYVLKCARFFQ